MTRCPPLSRFPAVALSGLARYEGSAFPADYAGNLFSAQHNARAVGRHVLSTQGATYRSEDRRFVTTDDPDFHPSDVLVDADGSLVVIDTGAWYVQHCPTGRIRPSPSRGGFTGSVIAGRRKASIPGARRSSGPALAPRPWRRGWPTPASRAREGDAGLGRSWRLRPLGQCPGRRLHSASAMARTQAVWTLAKFDAADTGPGLRRALDDPDQDVACSAARALGRRGGHEAAADLAGKLRRGERSPGWPPRRRRPSRGPAIAAACLRSGARSPPQPTPSSSMRWRWPPMAWPTRADLRAALDRPEPAVQAVALRLLDQPPRPRGVLAEADVMTRAGAADANLRRAAIQALGRHPEWAVRAADFVRRELSAGHIDESRLVALAGLSLAMHRQPSMQALLAELALDLKSPSDRRVWVLWLMARCHDGGASRLVGGRTVAGTTRIPGRTYACRR